MNGGKGMQADKKILAVEADEDCRTSLLPALSSRYTVLEAEDRFCYTCYREEATYGQVIPFLPNTIATAGGYQNQPANARLIKRMDAALFKERVLKMLLP